MSHHQPDDSCHAATLRGALHGHQPAASGRELGADAQTELASMAEAVAAIKAAAAQQPERAPEILRDAAAHLAHGRTCPNIIAVHECYRAGVVGGAEQDTANLRAYVRALDAASHRVICSVRRRLANTGGQ